MSVADASMIRFLLFAGVLIFFLIIEALNPYRKSTVSKIDRWFTNIPLAAFNTVIINLIFAASIVHTISYVTANKVGILNIFELPYWIKILATVIAMDFVLYVWHLLNHEVAFFWRFHVVHHCDLNMDVTTATRFHIIELSFGTIIKIFTIYIIGADLLGILFFESIVTLVTQFHHSSLKIPGWFESVFWYLFVPPSMHRIHHSVVINERNTNYGVIFSIWDRMLGTLLTTVYQDKIRIGVGAYTKQEKLKFLNLLVMPFKRPVR